MKHFCYHHGTACALDVITGTSLGGLQARSVAACLPIRSLCPPGTWCQKTRDFKSDRELGSITGSLLWMHVASRKKSNGALPCILGVAIFFSHPNVADTQLSLHLQLWLPHCDGVSPKQPFSAHQPCSPLQTLSSHVSIAETSFVESRWRNMAVRDFAVIPAC